MSMKMIWSWALRRWMNWLVEACRPERVLSNCLQDLVMGKVRLKVVRSCLMSSPSSGGTGLLCSAPAERSGDGAFGGVGTIHASPSGVAATLATALQSFSQAIPEIVGKHMR